MLTFNQWTRRGGADNGEIVCEVLIDGEVTGALLYPPYETTEAWEPDAALVKRFGAAVTGHRLLLSAQRAIREALA